MGLLAALCFQTLLWFYKFLLHAAGSGKESGLGLEQVVCWCLCQNMLLLLDMDDEVLIVTQNSKNADFSFLADCFV